MSDNTILKVENLKTSFPTRRGVFKAVDDVSFTLERGRTLAIVGESGSGKSVTARSILQIIDYPGRIDSGAIHFTRADGSTVDIATLDPRGRAIRDIRGKEIAMIFQEPMSSLSPVHRVGDQIGEALRIHERISRVDERLRVIELLKQVEIPNPETAIDRYTFEFSGGMRQRVMIAMALACNPHLLIADEPTTALDVTTQAEILDLIRRLQKAHGMAVIFITHDMGVVAEIADDVLVMYRGKVRESGPVEQIFHAPQDDYTRDLIGSVVKLEQKAEIRLKRDPLPTDDAPLLAVKDMTLTFPNGLTAVDNVSLTVRSGETLGIVGESGSGKTTMGRCLLRIYEPDAGCVEFRRADGQIDEVLGASSAKLKSIRREIRMIFQDPVGSLSPRKTVGEIIAEPLRLAGMRGKEREDEVCRLMEQVGLEPSWRERYPHAFSGGQRQRIGIARAISVKPRLIIADEATSALDVSLRSQMLDLMMQLQDEMGLSYIFISHDMSVIRYMCDRVAVMYRGQIVETGGTEQVVNDPQHRYTQALLSAIPNPDPRHPRLRDRFRYVAETAAP
ncbi:ABC transporter ATP-binding protein [Martelella mediterranea]|uniref:Glutathione import ATP-binding protein GsiA n=1 Tax=Martelella mediterranea DSM 17316 TaxID=1122214 RepID=A0A1U9Z9S5_9HYPH|nr:ABC transporter ATP-binding protein [Martelella mediterranea]AQZ54445.1 Glutathione import ATP-binding protein GsiA [Martelella mediterranea DSM 17316]